MDAKLKSIYYDPSHPAAYGGVAALAKAAKLTPKDVRLWLKGQAGYTLHKPARRHYVVRKYLTSGIDHQWQCDLVDMQKYAKDNDGYKHILTVIDLFSKYAWAEPIKSKTVEHVKPAFEHIFSERKPILIQSDQGTEFESRAMQDFFASYNIKQFSVKSQFKAAVVERFNRTLKTKMWRHFTHRNTHRWLEVLPKLLISYNKSFHRTIQMAPEDVNKDVEMEMWRKKEPAGKKLTSQKTTIKIGDHVRLSKAKRVFAKGYEANWTEEVFTVSRIMNTQPVQVRVKDYEGHEIDGSFYLHEIQLVDKPETFRIEKILRHRTIGGKKQYLVKWLGYSDHSNSWVSEEEVKNIQDG